MILGAPALSRARLRPAPQETARLVALLGVAVALRSLSTPAFVAVLALATLRSGWRPARVTFRALGWGLAGAVALVAGPLGRPGPHLSGRSGLLPWALGIALVVGAEEAFLRGALWRACEGWAGPAAALGLTSVAFALMHVPVYGWRAIPLDALVGLVLGGLRLASGSVAAPAVAHLVADWAGWWLV